MAEGFLASAVGAAIRPEQAPLSTHTPAGPGRKVSVCYVGRFHDFLDYLLVRLCKSDWLDKS